MTNKISEAYNSGQKKASLEVNAKYCNLISSSDSKILQKIYVPEHKKYMDEANQIKKPDNFLEKMAFNLGYSFEKMFY